MVKLLSNSDRCIRISGFCMNESPFGFRALMTSARARLIDLAASEALSHSRL
jgi:hypothetical protein